MSLLRELLYQIGHFVISRRQKGRQTEVDPSYGRWVYNETEREYDYIPPPPPPRNPHYISVLRKSRDEHVIVVDKEPMEDSIEILKCDNLAQVRIAVKMFTGGYRTQGKVTVDSRVRETESEPNN